VSQVRRVKLKCPDCGKTLIAPPELSGKWIRCPGCGDHWQLPNFQQELDRMVVDWLETTDRPAVVNNQARIIDDLNPPESRDAAVTPLMNEPPPPPSIEVPPADAPGSPDSPPAADLDDIESELDRLGLEPDGQPPIVRRGSKTRRRAR